MADTAVNVHEAKTHRLQLPEPSRTHVPRRLAANDFHELPVTIEHCLRTTDLPTIHRDPWDRLLVAQAQAEGLPLVSGDPAIARYDVETIW